MSKAAAYQAMFPAFTPTTKTVRTNAKLEHTLKLIPQIVAETLDQTRELAPSLRGQNITETCRNTWEFCKRNFKYRQDEDGKEQVRSPRRSWQDRHHGIDCDCYSTLISSILTNLRIPHMLRVTKYPDPDKPSTPAAQVPFSHIYVVAMDGGREVRIDPVTDFFDFEQPYLSKTDIDMTLEYLNGPPNQRSVDQADLGLGDLGLFRRKDKPKPNERTNEPSTLRPPTPQKGKGANVINRFNPAAILLRTGILLGMKLNMFNLGGNLRHAYLTDAQAKSRNLNMARLAHLRKVHAKLEHAVFLGGGKPENLKKAILEGKGNHDKAVPLNGLGLVSITPLGYGSDTHVSEILGPAIYQGEVSAYLNGRNGLGSLGEVTTAAAIAAATALLGAVAAVMKSVGDVTKGGAPGAAASEGEAAFTVPEYEATASDGQQPSADNSPVPYVEPAQEALVTAEGASATVEPITSESGPNQRASNSPNPEPEAKPGVVQWAKDNPMIAFGVIPAAAATLGYVIWKAVQKPPGKGGAVNGLDGKPPQAKARARPKGKSKGGGGKKKGAAYTLRL